MNPENRIRELFSEYPDVMYGFSDISYSICSRQYCSAVVIAVPYGKQVTAETYTEQDFEDVIQSAKARLESILQRLETLLQACGTAYHIPPVAQSDETELLAPFSFKYAINSFYLTNFLVGVFHGIVFGLIIALCGCYFGVNSGRNADSVGTATTHAVVYAIVWMIVMTGILTAICEGLGV